MFRKILIVLVVIVGVIVAWGVFAASQGVTQNDTPEISSVTFFEPDFMSNLSRQVTGGLSLVDYTSPAQVTLEELGELSPVVGMVEIEKDPDNAKTNELESEYIRIRALSTNAQPINISNWSVQSMVSDAWIGIPQGAELYAAGEVNELEDIYLYPGDSAIIASRRSPVGVSFRVNRCSGFLADTQHFEPRLRTSCLQPFDVIPPTVDNIKSYGNECVQFAENLGQCRYVTSDHPNFDALSSECQEFIQPRFTYNFCTGVYANDPNFFTPQEWRIFLNQDNVLWQENYEVIRILDEHNRTVDVLTY